MIIICINFYFIYDFTHKQIDTFQWNYLQRSFWKCNLFVFIFIWFIFSLFLILHTDR